MTLRRALRFIRCGVATLTALAARYAAAEPSTPESASGSATARGGAQQIAPLDIDITLVGAPQADSSLEARIGSWFEPARFHVHVAYAPAVDTDQLLGSHPNRGVAVWVSIAKNEARLYFVALDATRKQAFLVHKIGLDRGLDEVGAERLANVLRLSTVALAEGQATSPRVEVEEALRSDVRRSEPALQKPPSPVAPTTPSPIMRFGLGYAASWNGDEKLSHGPRLSVTGSTGALVLRLDAEGAWPHVASIGAVDVRLTGVSLGGAAGLRTTTHGLNLRGFAGVGANIVHYSPEAASNTVVLSRSVTEARPFLQLSAELGIPLDPVELTFGLRADLWLQKTHYQTENSNGARVLGGPGALSPGLYGEARF